MVWWQANILSDKLNLFLSYKPLPQLSNVTKSQSFNVCNTKCNLCFYVNKDPLMECHINSISISGRCVSDKMTFSMDYKTLASHILAFKM